MTVDKDNCPRCGKPTKHVASGSLTQWISAKCVCDLQSSDADSEPQLDLCTTCNRRIATSRPGSFTQWIFRQDYCACAKPTIATGLQSPVGLPAKSPAGDEEGEGGMFLEVSEFPDHRYRPLRLVGHGLYTETYLCQDKLLRKRVAVKSLRKSAQLPASHIVAFQNEAKIASTLNHENIIKVFDFGAAHGAAPYLVMEWFPGISVAEYMKEHGPLELTEALYVVLKLCDALANVHENKFYHRDIKPENVLMMKTAAGLFDIRLIDFGIAVTDQDIVNTVHLAGTPAYMSPEEMKERHRGERSEVYSVGCFLFACVSGNPPVSNETALSEVLDESRTAPRLSERSQQAVPAELDRIAAKCLSRNPDDRYESMRALAEDIQTVLDQALIVERSKADDSKHETVRIGGSSPNRMFVYGCLAMAVLAVFGIIIFENNDEKRPYHEHKRIEVIETVKMNPAEEEKQLEMSNVSDILDLSNREDTEEVVNNMINVPLRSVSLFRSNATDGVLKKLCEIKTIERLDLADTKITDAGLSCLPKLPKLLYLNLSGVKITDKGMSYVGKIKPLIKLKLVDSPITAGGARHLASLTNLEEVDCEGSSIGDGIAAFADLKHLTEMDLDNVGATDEGVRAISSMKQLEELELEGSKITSTSMKYFARMENLEELAISETSIDPSALQHLSKLRRLNDLAIGGLPITDKNIDAVISLKQIEKLKLNGTKITVDGLNRLAEMPRLRKVEIADCPNIPESAAKAFQRKTGIAVSTRERWQASRESKTGGHSSGRAIRDHSASETNSSANAKSGEASPTAGEAREHADDEFGYRGKRLRDRSSRSGFSQTHER